MPKIGKGNNSKKTISEPPYSAKKKCRMPTGMKDVSVRATKPKRSAKFTWFMKVYKGLDDWHIPIFRQVAAFTKAKYVLYPGSDKHITPSLIFPNVVYVDINAKVGPVFKDELVLSWISENKDYPEKTVVNFMCKNFNSSLAEPASFDLIISACAGIVSKSCAKYLKPGGYFLVSDAHFDARTVYLQPNFKLVGVYDKDKAAIVSDAEELDKHFHTVEGEPISTEQVEESMQKNKARRSFRLKKEAMFYLFQKTKEK